MAPRVGPQDQFETDYMGKLRSRLARRGITIVYEKDRAGLDLGYHLGLPDTAGNLEMTETRVWFQVKGRQSSTLSLEQFKSSDTVPVDVDLDLLRFWYAQPEATYLAVYIQAA